MQGFLCTKNARMINLSLITPEDNFSMSKIYIAVRLHLRKYEHSNFYSNVDLLICPIFSNLDTVYVIIILYTFHKEVEIELGKNIS